jgi:hypothetical protein
MKILYESNLSVVVPPQFPWIIVISIEGRWKRWMLLRDKRRQHTHTHMPPPPPERGRAPQHWAESGMANVMDARVQNRETVGGAYIGSSSSFQFQTSFLDLRTQCFSFLFFCWFMEFQPTGHRANLQLYRRADGQWNSAFNSLLYFQLVSDSQKILCLPSRLTMLKA